MSLAAAVQPADASAPSARPHEAAALAARRTVTRQVRARGESKLLYFGSVASHHDIQLTPKVYVVFWGRWAPGSAATFDDPANAQPYITSFVQGIGDKGDDWSAIANGYCAGSTETDPCAATNRSRVRFRPGSLVGTWNDTANPPVNPSDAQILAEAQRAAAHFGHATRSASRDYQYVIATPHGVGSLPDQKFCAWHDFGQTAKGAEIAYIYLPYTLDSHEGCGENFVNQDARGKLDGVSLLLGHEIFEAATDPSFVGWFTNKGNEIADLCQWYDGQGGVRDVTFTTGRFAVQGMFSNLAYGGKGGCINQSALAGAPTSPLDVAATTVDAQDCTVTFAAPTSAGAQPIVGYAITSTPATPVVNAPQPGSVVVGNLVAGTPYTFAVRAINAYGASLPSAASAVCTPA